MLALLVASLSLTPSAPVALRALQGSSNYLDAREWNQPRGNAAGTAALDLEPVESEPELLWQQPLGDRACEPVTWAGVIYVVSGTGRKRALQAFRIEDGSPAGSMTLGGQGELFLASWNGSLAVIEHDRTSLFQQKSNALWRQETVERGSLYPPCMYGGWLFVSDGNRLTGIEMRTGTLQDLAECGPYRPAALPGKEPGTAELAVARHVARPGYEGELLAVLTHKVSGLDTQKLAISLEDKSYGSTLASGSALAGRHGYLARLDEASAWFVFSPSPLRTNKDAAHGSLVPLNRLAPIVGEAACRLGRVYGFSAAAELIAVREDGSYATVLGAEHPLPIGARPGAVSMARQVLYLGNWAVDTEDKRVVWCLPELVPASSLIPVADGRVVCLTFTPDLRCYAGSAEASASAASASVPANAPSRPGSGPGVVLTGGRRVAGAVTLLEDGRVRVATEPVLELERSTIALLEKEGSVQLLGEEHSVLLAWWDALRFEHLQVLGEFFASYRKAGHLEECRRLIEEARAFDAEPELVETWSHALVGKAPNRSVNVDKQRARLVAKEDERRVGTHQAFLAAAEWCAENGFDTSATVLLARAGRVTADPAVMDLAAALAPERFPWKSEPAAAALWMRFAEELLPAGGQFVDPSELLPKRARSRVWSRGYAVSTDNLVLFTGEESPEIVGSCLRNGEGVLRVLTGVFGVEWDESARLEVRLHRDRQAYLREFPSGMDWSAGGYSPAGHFSCFYVPRAADGTADVRELTSTLVHELTHQFLAERWHEGGPLFVPGQPGFWLIEGVAEFCQGQVMDLGRRRRSIDDRKALSIDISAQLAPLGRLFPLAELLQMTQAQFTELDDKVAASVRPRHTLDEQALSQRGIFYQQSASLFFFLFHGRGEEGRARLLRLLRAEYENRYPSEPWTALGWDDLEELERADREFLAECLR